MAEKGEPWEILERGDCNFVGKVKHASFFK